MTGVQLHRLLGWALAVIVALTTGSAVVFSPVAQGMEPARSDLPELPGLAAKVVTQPSDGATNVSPIGLVRASVTGGVFDAVSLTSSDGTEIAGQFSPDKKSWTATEPLRYATTYTWSGTATGIDHLSRKIAGSFQTVNPERLVGTHFNVADNATYGIAMPIALTFSSRVLDKAAVERALAVHLSEPTEGPGRG